MRVCSVQECGREHFGLGFCFGHYRRFKLYGDPNAGQRAFRGSPVAWLKEHLGHSSDDCLIWPFGRREGYGAVTLDGTPMRASRAMCILKHGHPTDPCLEAAHGCGNKICVNPKHLRWATPAENSADKWAHGTMLVGEACNGAKLTAADVLEIRRLAGLVTQRAIADRFGIRQGAVSTIINKKSWRHV